MKLTVFFSFSTGQCFFSLVMKWTIFLFIINELDTISFNLAIVSKHQRNVAFESTGRFSFTQKLFCIKYLL